MRWLVLAAALTATDCTRPNPRSCADGVCDDPARPFCDVAGQFEDIPNQCIAVDCTPMELAGCRGDLAITCNAAGTNYDLVECARGCEDGTGCRLCNPSETACTNGTVATCDAAGTVIESQPCPLGCFEDEPRCRDIDPSNNLGQFLDMVPTPPDVDLVNASIFTDTGVVRMGGEEVSIPSFLVSAPQNGAAIRVFVTNNLRLDSVNVVGLSVSGDQGPAVAFVTNSDIVVRRISIQANAGQVFFPECLPGPARDSRSLSGTQVFSAGGGGGGHATPGAAGGDVPTDKGILTGGRAGLASGSETLIPLHGGCSGSGAVQLSSRTQITIDGTIDVRGRSGDLELGNDGSLIGGGGAGGGILLEAPAVVLTANARLLAKGGAGAANTSSAGTTPPTEDLSASLGARCIPNDPQCGDGGNGATVNVAATAGESSVYNTELFFSSGGGGGGLGRLRINTLDGTYTKNSLAIEAGATTAGSIRTR